MSYLETTHIDKVINNYCSRICHRIKCYTINNTYIAPTTNVNKMQHQWCTAATAPTSINERGTNKHYGKILNIKKLTHRNKEKKKFIKENLRN